jgi:hypothetical protein
MGAIRRKGGGNPAWVKGVSGNPKGSVPAYNALAPNARQKIEKHKLVEELCMIATGTGKYLNKKHPVAIQDRIRAIQILFQYGYPNKGGKQLPLDGEEGVKIEVTYTDNRKVINTSPQPQSGIIEIEAPASDAA